MIEIIQADDLAVASIIDESPDYAVAWRFSQFLKDWLPVGLGRAHTRIDTFRHEKGLPLSGSAYEGHLHWTALAITLNGLGELRTDDFLPVRQWAERHADGWLILFFGAGLHLSGDDAFPWIAMARFLAGVDARSNALLNVYQTQARTDRGRQESAHTAEHSHDLEREPIVIDQVADVGVPLFADQGEAPLVIGGACYAYEFARLAANPDQPWHWTLMRAALVALATLRSKSPALASYESSGGLVRLFLREKPSHESRRPRAVGQRAGVRGKRPGCTPP